LDTGETLSVKTTIVKRSFNRHDFRQPSDLRRGAASGHGRVRPRSMDEGLDAPKATSGEPTIRAALKTRCTIATGAGDVIFQLSTQT
jgi:hypothetical protein